MYYLPINGKYLWKISNCNNLIKEKNIVINEATWPILSLDVPRLFLHRSKEKWLKKGVLTTLTHNMHPSIQFKKGNKHVISA